MGLSSSSVERKSIVDDLVEDHLRRFSELQENFEDSKKYTDHLFTTRESITRMLYMEWLHNRDLEIRLAELLKKYSVREGISAQSIQLKEAENVQLRADIDRLKNTNAAYTNQVSQLQSQILVHQQTIDGLTKTIEESEEKLHRESSQLCGTMKMLVNERKQSKEYRKTLKKQVTQLRNIKLVATNIKLEDLKNYTEIVSEKIIKNVTMVNHRDNYKMKFENLKDGNDRMIKDLETVTFTTRLYQRDHDALVKLQVETDRSSMDILKTIQRITKDCKKLVEEYNTSLQERFKKAIANHERDLDALGKVDLTPQFTREVALQESILNHLSKEKDMLECILDVEKSNNLTEEVQNNKPKKNNNLTEVVKNNTPKCNNQKNQVQEDKVNNLEYTNNLGLNKGKV